MVWEEASPVDISMIGKHLLLSIHQTEDWGKTLFKNIWKVEIENTEFCYSEAGCFSLCN